MTSTGMIAIDSADAFLASPVGRCLVRADYLLWCSSPAVVGVIHWGSLNCSFIQDLIDLGSRLLVERLAAPHVLCDFRDLESVHVEDVVDFVEGSPTPRLDPRARIGGVTVVLPGGLPGILVAGATAVLSSTADLVFTSDISEALSSLGPDAAARYVTIENTAMEARGTSLLVARVRNHITRDLTGATVENCAAALRTSERTLQRRLRAAGTSYGEQLRRARVDAASQLVKFSDLKIDAIAARVGLGNASRLSAIFRAEFGVTPGQLRIGQLHIAADPGEDRRRDERPDVSSAGSGVPAAISRSAAA